MTTRPLPAAQALALDSLVTPTPNGISSRVLSKTDGGSVTAFAFAEGEGLTEHTSPYDALVLVIDGTFRITIGGTTIDAPRGTLVRLPAAVPHAVDAAVASRMLLIMLRDSARSPGASS